MDDNKFQWMDIPLPQKNEPQSTVQSTGQKATSIETHNFTIDFSGLVKNNFVVALVTSILVLLIFVWIKPPIVQKQSLNPIIAYQYNPYILFGICLFSFFIVWMGPWLKYKLTKKNKP